MVSSGRPTTRVATRLQKPRVTGPGVGTRGQKTAFPRMASSAGRSVRLANSAMAMPMASAGPNPL